MVTPLWWPLRGRVWEHEARCKLSNCVNETFKRVVKLKVWTESLLDSRSPVRYLYYPCVYRIYIYRYIQLHTCNEHIGGIAIGNKNRITSDIAATLSLTLLRSGRSTAPKIPRKQGLIESCANWHGFRAELVFELTMFSFLVQELNFGDEKSNGFTSFIRFR